MKNVNFLDLPFFISHGLYNDNNYLNNIYTLNHNFFLPRISIIIPTYNNANFIEQTIRSILLQNYPNFELIIIDGKSNDNTKDIITKYTKWIDVFISETDRGQSDAINKGWKLASGDITNWINSDDFLAPNVFNILAEYVNKHGLNNIFVGHVINFNNNNTNFEKVVQNVTKFENLIKFWDKDILWHQPGFFFPLKSIINIDYLDISYHYSMDFDLLCKLLIDTNVIIIDVPFMFFRIHNNSKGVSSPINTVIEKMNIFLKNKDLITNLSLVDKIKYFKWFLKSFCKIIITLNFLNLIKFLRINFQISKKIIKY